jgi:hypothetical protein
MSGQRKPKAWQVGVSIALAAAVSASAQSSTANHNVTTDVDYPAPYDGSKADKALKSFDERHPECATWTDWHKLCERIGPGGRTLCDVDSTRPVAPSVPFCARETGFTSFALGDGPANETLAERTSRFRFKKSVRRYPALRHLSNGHVENYLQTSVNWKESRPFNGRTPFGFDYAACALWAYQAETGDETKCATDGRADIAPCPNPHKVPLRSQPKCIKIAENSVCNPKLYAANQENLADSNPDRIAPYVDGLAPTAFPVHGFKCPWVE